MKKINIKSVKAILTIVLLSFSFFVCTSASAQTAKINNVVLVHGAFADGSGWKKVYEILTKKGYTVTIAQIPLTSFTDDVAAVKTVIDRIEGPIVLVGHSWGGTVISEAGIDPKVKSLVYVAAFVPEVGETTGELANSLPSAPENGILPADKNGFSFYDKDKFHAGFAGDLSKEESDFMYASQIPIATASFDAKVSKAAWKTKPSYAVLTTQDKSILPEIQRKMYTRAKSYITEIKASHVVFISQSETVASMIIKATQNMK